MGQNVVPVILYAEASYPAIEDLNGVCACLNLISRIGRSHGYQLLHQRVPVFRAVVHHLLCMNVIARASALNHVAGQGKRSSTESDHRHAIAKVLGYEGNGFGNVSQFRRAVGSQSLDVFLRAHRLFDHRTFSS